MKKAYLNAYQFIKERSSKAFRDLYNARRPQASLDGLPPDQFYSYSLPLSVAAYQNAEINLYNGDDCLDNRSYFCCTAQQKLSSS